MKAYPLEIEEIWDMEFGGYAVYSKGHHDIPTFVKATEEITTIEAPATVEETRHKYARYMPPWYAKERCCASYILFGIEPGRGAFPVTVCERW
jgi:hypothetical protein